MYRGIATRADITRVTRRLGDDIAKVYGFSDSPAAAGCDIGKITRKTEVRRMAILYKALTELYRETQRKVTAPSEWQALFGCCLPQLPIDF